MNNYKLRIAWSAMWLAMALLLAVLWPLSYQAQYGIRYQGAPACAVVSTQVGSVFASIYNSPMIVPDGWRIMSEPINGADFVQGFAIGRTNAVQHWGVYISLPPMVRNYAMPCSNGPSVAAAPAEQASRQC
jgi:hypothetical protein